MTGNANNTRARYEAEGVVSSSPISSRGAPTIEERFPALNDHLIRMASTGQVGSLTEWGEFFNDLRAALFPVEAANGSGPEAFLMGGRLEPSLPPEGCYCKDTCGAPKIMGRQMPCLRNPAFPLPSPPLAEGQGHE